MIVPVFGCASRGSLLVLLAQLYDREPQILGHAVVTELPRLPDAPLVDRTRLVPAPEMREYVAQARISVALVVLVRNQLALENRRLVLVAPGLLVLVRQGHEAGRVVRVVRELPFEVLDPVLHALLSSR